MKHEKGFYLSRVKTTSFPHRFLFIDSETLKFKEYNIDLHKMRLAVTCYIRLGKTPFNINTEVWNCFYTQESICEYIDHIAYGKNPLWIVASNPKFDVGAIGLIYWFTKWNWKLDFIAERGMTFILTLHNKSKRIKIIALQNFYTTGITRIGKLLGKEKIEIDVFTQDMDKLLEYCKMDVEILKDGFLKYLQFIYINDMGNFGYTKAAQSFIGYKKRFMYKKILIHKYEDVSILERSGYHGGRVECFRIGKQAKQDYVQVDINSLYPFVMKNFAYPYKISGHIQKENLDHLEKTLKTKCVTARVLICTDEPVYAKTIDKKCCFPIGTFWETLNTRALKYGFTKGHIKDVSIGIYYHKYRLFKDYIDYFWDLRLKAQQDNDSLLEQLIKYMLNSLYGKFAQQVPIVISTEYEPENKFEIEHWYNEVTKTHGITKTLFHKTEISAGIKDSKNTFVSISAHITEDARFTLWSFIDKCGVDNVYYCDTDSLIVNRETYIKHLKQYANNKLGNLKIEKEGTHLKIYTLKDYELDDKIIIKGVGKGKAISDNSEYEVLICYSITKLMQLNIQDAAVLTPITKQLKRIYTKGIVSKNGFVAPFHLQETKDSENFQIAPFGFH